MRRRRARAAASLRGALVVVVAAAALVACGNGDDKETKAPVTVPRDTTAPEPTTPPPSLPSGPLASVPPRPWRTGFANGVMPLQLDDVALAKDLDGMAATGARWLRVDFYWPTVQDDGPDSWNWSGTDRIVKMAHARGLEILAMPAYSPDWARPPGTIDHHPPLNPDWYARFVSEAAKRYAPLGVHTWEIWNEPNVDVFWPPRPDPEGYTELLKRAYVAIKAVDPKATDPSDWNSFYNAPTLYQVMADHGDGDKKIWGTEFGSPTAGPGASVTPEFQRDILVTGYRTWLSWPFTGPLLVYAYRDYANDPGDREANFGLVHFDGTPKIALGAFEGVVNRLEADEKRGPS